MRFSFASSFLVLSFTIAACNGATVPLGDASRPSSSAHVLELSTYSESLGTPIDVFVENLPPEPQSVSLVFDGTFARAGGGEEPVSLSQPLVRSDDGALRWTTFGPFGNPFTPTNPDIGTFHGKIGVQVTMADGSVTTEDRPLPIDFEVKPSIVVTELQPTTAACEKAALRLIGLLSYKMKAMALGFEALSFDYEIKTPEIVLGTDGQPTMAFDAQGNAQLLTRTVSHAVSAPVDSVEGEEAIALPAVPADRKRYGVLFSISARTATGETVRSAFGMTAHRPLEFDSMGSTLTQIYPAEPVSSCIPGGDQGREVGYSESQAATRERRSTLTLSTSWLKSDENSWTTTDGKTVTTQRSTGDAFTRIHGTSNTFVFERNGSPLAFYWRDWPPGAEGVGAVVELAIPGISAFNAGAGTEGVTTDSAAIAESNTKDGSPSAQEDSWRVSSADTIGRDFRGSVIANTYGVFYRQLARTRRNGVVLEYDKCGESEVIGDVTLQDYSWAPDLALGTECPPFPKTNLPEPVCSVGPCDD